MDEERTEQQGLILGCDMAGPMWAAERYHRNYYVWAAILD